MLFRSGNAAARGEVVVLYATGLGRVNPAVNSGEAARNAAPTANKVTVNIGGRDVDPDYAGIAPGFVGLYQVNVRIPADLVAGELAVKLKVAGSESNAATLSIK